jgi:uncharacterized protein YjbI with pentapeptide repeats
MTIITDTGTALHLGRYGHLHGADLTGADLDNISQTGTRWDGALM